MEANLSEQKSFFMGIFYCSSSDFVEILFHTYQCHRIGTRQVSVDLFNDNTIVKFPLKKIKSFWSAESWKSVTSQFAHYTLLMNERERKSKISKRSS